MSGFSKDVKDFLYEEDKRLHIVVSLMLTLFILLFLLAIGVECLAFSPYVIALGIGIAKEVIWDLSMGRGTPSMRDIYADVIGVTIAYGFIAFCNTIWSFL